MTEGPKDVDKSNSHQFDPEHTYNEERKGQDILDPAPAERTPTQPPPVVVKDIQD